MKNDSNVYSDPESERSILGAILIDNALLDEATGLGLKPEDFYIGQHQIIFRAILDLEKAGSPVDLVTLTSRLNQIQQFQAIGGTSTLTALFEDAFRVSNSEAYTKVVLERSRLRKLAKTLGEIQSQMAEGIEDVPGFLNSVEASVFEATQSGRTEGLKSVRDILPEFINEIEERAASKTDMVGLRTGFHEVDALTNGLRPHQIWVVAARPGMGKTSFVLSIIQSVGIRNPGVIAMFSMEMKQTELMLRLASGHTGIDSKRLMLGRLKDTEWQRLAETADLLARSRVFIDESGGVTALEIRSRCRRLKHREKRLDLVVVDYLQLIKPMSSKNSGTPESDLATISRNLKELAKELNVPIIVLSQLNRATVTEGQDKRPSLANLRGSGAIEQDADMVAFIHREDAYDLNTDEKGIAEIIFRKNRAGEQGTARLAWIPNLTLFANLQKDQ